MKKHNSTLICLAATLLLLSLLPAFSGCDYVRGETAPEEKTDNVIGESAAEETTVGSDQHYLQVIYAGDGSATVGAGADELEVIREKYPGYFELNPADGIDIIVWQMAHNSYSFALRPHEEGRTNAAIDDLYSANSGLNVNQMRKLIAAREIDKNDVTIIPWQNLLSSYLPPYMMSFEGENEADRAARKQDYILTVEKILFGDAETSLRLRFPEFFELNASGGLRIYALGTAGDAYYYCITEKKGEIKTERDLALQRRMNAENLKTVLNTYSVRDADVEIIPMVITSSFYKTLIDEEECEKISAVFDGRYSVVRPSAEG